MDDRGVQLLVSTLILLSCIVGIIVLAARNDNIPALLATVTTLATTWFATVIIGIGIAPKPPSNGKGKTP